MSTVLKARVIRIGNSQGIRIPKIWLEQLHLGEEIEMTFESDQIIIRPIHRARKNWEQHFEAMAVCGDDLLLDSPTPTEWDLEEWEW